MSTSSEVTNLDRLKPKRAAQRGLITRNINEVSSALENGDVTAERLQARNSKLDKINEEIEPYHPAKKLEEEY